MWGDVVHNKKMDYVLSRVSALNGEKFRCAYRAGATITLCFGEDVPCIGTFQDNDGNILRGDCLKPKYSLHVQCTFSISRRDKILLSDVDLCRPSKSFKQGGKDFEKEPDEIGNNRYDELTMMHPKKIGYGETVKDVKVSEFGNMVIEMTKGFYMLIIPYRKYKKEAWRFFETGNTESHLVVSYKKILER